MNLSDRPTPETDKFHNNVNNGLVSFEEYMSFSRSLEQRLTEALEKLANVARCVDISEKLCNASSDKQIELAASFDEAMAYTLLDQVEAKLAKAEASNVALREVADKLAEAIENRAVHPPTCAVHDPFADDDNRRCTCGRVEAGAKALAEYSKLNPETK